MPAQQQYIIWDTITKQQVGQPSTNKVRLIHRADKLDARYGAYRYYVHPYTQENTTAWWGKA